jgi:hypothetical protein
MYLPKNALSKMTLPYTTIKIAGIFIRLSRNYTIHTYYSFTTCSKCMSKKQRITQ